MATKKNKRLSVDDVTEQELKEYVPKSPKKSFVVYFDYLDYLLDFEPEEIGNIFLALLEYGRDGTTITAQNFKGGQKMFFKMVQKQMDIDYEKWLKRCYINQKNRTEEEENE